MKQIVNKYHASITRVGLLAVALFFTAISFAQDGKALFDDNCGACHQMGKKVVGPDLTGVVDRRSEEWVASFIKNSTAMIESGDAEAIKVWEENNKIPMTAFEGSMDDAQIGSIVGFLKDYKEVEVIAVVEPPVVKKPTKPVAPADPQAETSKTLLWAVLTVPVLIFVILLVSGVYSFFREANRAGGMESNVLTGKITDEVIEGHSYDGIQELNNSMPPWLKWLFYVTVVFALIYTTFYFGMNGPTQDQEYQKEMAEAVEKYGDMDVVAIDLKMVDDAAALATGQEIYVKNCAACHKEDGGGSIGPNLTDDYWKNGGSLKEVFTTIREGVPGKAMVPWKGKISDQDILSIATLIKKMKGTNPAGAKEKEGKLYEGE